MAKSTPPTSDRLSFLRGKLEALKEIEPSFRNRPGVIPTWTKIKTETEKEIAELTTSSEG